MLSAGTTQATLGLGTNEAATCRYSTVAGTTYAAMTGVFTTTGALTHSTVVGGLANGQSYTFYVRCQDVAGNANTNDFPISFSVASAATGLVAAYSFDAGTGTVLTDVSGNGNNGTINGATWTTGHDGQALVVQRHEQRRGRKRQHVAGPDERDDAGSVGTADIGDVGL